MKLMTMGGLARMVFEELDLDLNYILWHYHDHPLHDSILGFLWGYYQLFCCPEFIRRFSRFDI